MKNLNLINKKELRTHIQNMKNLYLENLSLSKKFNSLLSPSMMELARKASVYSNSTILDEFTKSAKIGLPPTIFDMVSKLKNITNDPTMAMINRINSQVFNNEILNRINSLGYWGQIVSMSLYDEIQSSEGAELAIAQELTSDIDILNENPLEIFNKLVISIKTYIDENPSVKYSSQLVIWLISVIIIPIILAKSLQGDDKPNTTSIINNNYYIDTDVKAKANQEIQLRNHPRDKSKIMFVLQKDDEVKILKDSIKWCFVIKNNTVESGWIRKEYLRFTK